LLSIDSCENYVVPRGVQRNPFSKHLLDAHPTAYLGSFEEEKRNDVTVEKKEKHKDLFKIDQEFNNLSFINRDDSGKTTTNKH
jgi:hypothetical protein